ncbi:Tol biopolymer transport system component [Catalinimonas alkaloidigena]|uniref:translocation protein TolB n=1 Tax=Catalinimonas alkaloidigena TaxID=1075417 RepID=UPI0024058376|nr:translocation protein TolB [Catalinimonas alkaloidigena]MDF9797710.1 Tol biopolymer transport system component [Catalinimonas alkaloidigena]
MNRFTYIPLIFLLVATTFSGHAQINTSQFGQNRVQYKNFNWRFYSSDNFDIYFYDGGQDNALIAAKFIEKEFERITDIIGYAPYSKTKIFLYNSNMDLLQSNVGVGGNKYNVGGQTDFIKSQVEIAYPGTMIAFKDELVKQISEMLISDMMFGGSLTDMFQSAYLLSLPEWFIQGAARYIAEGWSIEMDDFMREQFRENNSLKLGKLSGEDAALAGQSVWNYIAARYGRSSISNILNLTRIIRNEESSIVNTLGIPYKLFMRQWASYYAEMATQVNESYDYPEAEQKLRNKNRKNLAYNHVAFSPDGTYLAYSENYKGKYKVKVLNLKNNKTKTVHASGYKVINQDYDTEVPLLSWSNTQTLGIVGYEKGRNYMWLYNVAAKSKRRITLNRFNQVKSLDFNSNGRLAIMSADLNGQNDLYLYNPNRNTFRRITNDIYDDIYPRFIPESDKIVFSSNRPEDSLYYVNQSARDIQLNNEIDDNFNIFIYEGDETDSLLNRVTNTVSKDINPIPLDENTIYYLSDQRGIYNIYKYNLTDSLFNQVTNYALSVQDFDINFSEEALSFIMLSEEDDYVYMDKSFDLNQNIFTPKTQRQEAIQARAISQRLTDNKRKLREQGVADSSAVIAPSDRVSQLDSLIIDVPDSLLSDSIIGTVTLPMQDSIPLDSNMVNTEDYTFDAGEAEGIIDTDNYVFDTPERSDDGDISTDNFRFESDEESGIGNSFLARYRKLQKETRINGPFPYETRFSADNIVTSLTVDPLRRFGFNIQVQMNDMLENHRFYGGLVQYTDLQSGNIYAEYEYLKNRVDFRARYERNGYLFNSGDRDIQKYTTNMFRAGASLPFNNTTRFELNPFYTNTYFIDLSQVSANIESTFHYGGINLGLVFDNTLVTGLKNFEGTRAKIFFTHYQGLNDPDKTFSNIEVDVRHYQKLYRDITLATRVFYGNFFGNNAQKYLLGGMSNWLFFDTESQEEDDPLAIERNVDNSNIVFTQFTDLRGFNYNKFNGTDVLTFTAELRLPIIRFFHRGPIASNFFRNLEFVGFYDIGSSWTGTSPFSEKNSLNTEVIEDGGPFRAEISNFKNPWLMSYGAGVRTVLLGYYLKFDMAYPIEDGIVGDKPKFYLTLGYDF